MVHFVRVVFFLQILRCLFSLLNFSSVYSHIVRGLDYNVKHFLKSRKTAAKSSKFVRKLVSERVDVCGFDVVPSFFNTKNFLYLCPAHNSAYIRAKGVSQVRMAGFDSMYMYMSTWLIIIVDNS